MAFSSWVPKSKLIYIAVIRSWCHRRYGNTFNYFVMFGTRGRVQLWIIKWRICVGFQFVGSKIEINYIAVIRSWCQSPCITRTVAGWVGGGGIWDCYNLIDHTSTDTVTNSYCSTEHSNLAMLSPWETNKKRFWLKPAIGFYPGSNKFSLESRAQFSIPNGILQLRFPSYNFFFNVFLIYTMHATCPPRPIVLDLITVTIHGEEKLCLSVFQNFLTASCNFSHRSICFEIWCVVDRAS